MQARRQFLRMGWGLGVSSCFAFNAQAAASEAHALVWQEKILQGFGTTLRLRAGHHHEAQLQLALQEAVQTIRRIESLMSLFDDNSTLQQLNREGLVRQADSDFHQVMAFSQHLSQRSQGAFDVSMQPLWGVWSQWAQQYASQADAPLTPEWVRLIEQARQLVNWRAVDIQPQHIKLPPGMAVSLNGIAQGFASDKVKAVMQQHGIRHALLDTGETSMLGASPQGAWRLGIESVVAHAPTPVVRADGRAMATSSQAHTSFSVDRRFHHILDPRTGYSPSHWASVTVLAPSCTLADGLTKVFFMLTPQQVLPAARTWGVDVLLQHKTGSWLRTPGVSLVG